MNITVIGASAGIGLETVKWALERSHKVTTLSRSPLQIPAHKNLHIIIGDALHREDLKTAVKDADAVIVTLGTRKNMKATTMFSDFARVLVDVQTEKNTQVPHLVVTGFGAGESQKYMGLLPRLFLKYMLKDVYADKTKMEQIITASNLNWVIVRPGRLLDEPRTGVYRIETRLYKGIGIGGINRSDVADFLVQQAENPTELKKYPAISQK